MNCLRRPPIWLLLRASSALAAIVLLAAAAPATRAANRLRIQQRDLAGSADSPQPPVRVGNWIVEAAAGGTLRFRRELTPRAHCGSGPAAPSPQPASSDAAARNGARVADDARVAVGADVTAVTAFGWTVYAALANGTIAQVDATDPARPTLARRIRHQPGVRALAANGARLYALGTNGLLILDLDAGTRHLEPGIDGRALVVAGRQLRVWTDGGEILTVRDDLAAPLLTTVSVSNNFYQPEDVTIDVGDTVRWTNVSGIHHNVYACTATQVGCGGETAAEAFGSGSASEFFVYEHTFTAAGANPYICQPHAPFMIGSVTVTGGSGGNPPAVPDGSPGAPAVAAKLTADGSSLSISWDTAACTGAIDHQVVFGYGYQLPGATGGGYELAGSRCGLGSTSPQTWSGVPPAFATPTGFLWWLVLATDGDGTEGSWGTSSVGGERQGPGPDGASLECGSAAKSTVNSCGQ